MSVSRRTANIIRFSATAMITGMAFTMAPSPAQAQLVTSGSTAIFVYPGQSGNTAGGQIQYTDIVVPPPYQSQFPVEIKVGGTTATRYTAFNSPYYADFYTPPGQGRNLPISLRYADNTVFSWNGAYSYRPPAITGFSPVSGAAAGGSTVTLNGSNFGLSPTVTIGGVSATVSARTHTRLTCVVPPGSGSGKQVTINVGGQSATATQTFAYDPPSPPVISSISPASGSTAGGYSITLTGANLGASFPTVTIGAASASVISYTSTSITATVPASEGVDLPVVVTAGGVTGAFSGTFSYDPPTVSSIMPVVVGTAGGTTVTLSGNNFGLTPPEVTVGGFPTSVTLATHTSIQFLAPAGQGTPVPVLVTAAGQITTASITFGYSAPTLTSISPSTFGTAGGTTVTLLGSNFGTRPPAVSFGGAEATVTTYTHTGITCLTPAGQGSGLAAVIVSGQVSGGVAYDRTAPSITSIIPATGPTAGGTTITVTGSDFGLSPTVTVGGSPATVVSSTHTGIVCRTPAGQGTGRPVVVTVAGTPSNSVPFDYAAPVVTSITPSFGATSGGYSVNISGSNFGTAPPSVTIGGNSATVTSSSHTALTVTVPAGQGASQTVLVTCAGQTNAGGPVFSYAAPTVASVSPTTGPTAGGTTVLVTGSSFGLSPSVTLGGAAAPVTSSTHTGITCTSPAGEGAATTVTVSVAGQAGSLAGAWSYGAPTIFSVSPSSGVTGGGNSVTITGSNFGFNPTVEIGGTTATVNSSSHSAINCNVPAGEGTGKAVRVTVAGQTATLAAAYSYTTPTLSSIIPATGSTSGGFTMNLSGTSFGLNPTVTLGGVGMPVVSRSHTTIDCTVPAGQGTGLPVVVTVTGAPSNSIPFSYAAPTVTSVSPVTGSTAGGYPIIISGSNFGAAVPSVTIGGTPATVTAASQTSLTVTAPAGSGTGKAVVVTAGGQSSTGGSTFSYAAPTVASVSPTTGPTAGGNTVTIAGDSFGLSPTVSIGGSPAAVTTSSHTAIQCLAPAGEGVGKTVQVTAGAQAGTLSSAYSYAPPVITSITPDTGQTSGGYTIDVVGWNFGLFPLVTIGGASAPVTSSSHTFLRCTVPAGEGTSKSVTVIVAGQANSGGPLFSYAAPAISSVTPNSGATGGGNSITVSGSNFGLSPVVTIGSAAASIVSSNHSQIVCTVPAGEGAGLPVQVTAGGQSGVLPAAYSYNAPSVSTILPASGLTAGGYSMAITGSGFGLAPTVKVGGLNAPVTAASHTAITCTVPAGEGVSKAVTVTAGGQSSVGGPTFSYSPPTLFSIAPPNGPTAGGNTLTLNGTSFGLTPSVTVGGSPATVTSNSHTRITCLVPAGAGLGRPVVVTVQGASSNSLGYSYDAPVLAAVTPPFGPLAGGTTLTLTGVNLGASGQSVTVGGAVAPVLASVGHTTVTCLLPPGGGVDRPVVLTVGGQASNAILFSYDTLTSSSVTPAGDTAQTTYGDVRIAVDFADGSTSGGSSLTTVTLFLDPSGLGGLPGAGTAGVYWRIDSNRVFTSARVTVTYRDGEVSALREGDLVLYHSTGPNGPWIPVANLTVDTANNTVSGDVPHFSYFALSGPLVPVAVSGFGVE